MKKKVTINQVAEQAGVSKTTVSRFLNNNYKNMSLETKERIAAVIQELNYRPSRQAQALKSKRSYLIGVVVADISNMYSSLLLKGIGNVLERYDYQMIIMDAANSIEQEHDLLEKLLDQSVEGIILQPSSIHSENYRFIKERRVPLLLVDRQTRPFQWSCVMPNDVDSIQQILAPAMAGEYEKVVVISEPLDEVYTRQVRWHTVKEIAEKAGKAVELLEVKDGEVSQEQILTRAASSEKILLFASNGRVLMNVLTILIENKLAIPNDIGITGFDDWNLTALVGPGITSIEQQSQKIGETAAEELMGLLKTKEYSAEDIIVPTKIQWRNSI